MWCLTFNIFDIVDPTTISIDLINESISHVLIRWTQESLINLKMETQRIIRGTNFTLKKEDDNFNLKTIKFFCNVIQGA